MPSSNNTQADNAALLPRRDWIILPLLSFLTVFLILTFALIIQRTKYSETPELWTRCMVVNDPSTGLRGIPNSVCRIKSFESPLVEYRMNSCGHRTTLECGHKPPNTYRIVTVGSSFVLGMRVPVEQTFAAVLPRELSEKTGKKVELYNEGMNSGYTHSVALKFDQALAEKPDMILWVITPLDIKNALELTLPTDDGERASTAARPSGIKGIVKRIQAQITKEWAVIEPGSGAKGRLLNHFLYSSQSLLVNQFLRMSNGDEDSQGEFLKAEPNLIWQKHLRDAEIDAANIEGQAKAAGVPFVAVLLPEDFQAAMISMGEWPAAYDPYKLDNDLRAMIERHGGTYISILPDFRSIPNPEQHYYPVDGHLDAVGHAMIADMLTKELTSGAVPDLQSANSIQPQSGKEN